MGQEAMGGFLCRPEVHFGEGVPLEKWCGDMVPPSPLVGATFLLQTCKWLKLVYTKFFMCVKRFLGLDQPACDDLTIPWLLTPIIFSHFLPTHSCVTIELSSDNNLTP